MKKTTALVLISLLMATFPTLVGAQMGHGGCPHQQGDMGNHGSMNHSAHGQGMDHGQDMSDMNHEQNMNDMDHGQDMTGMDRAADQHSGGMGQAIRETRVKDHTMQYRLIDMQKQMEGMENKPAMSATHHLMVYVKRPDGTQVDNAKVGYLVAGSGGNTQKTMAMGMGGGYGADLDLSGSDSYTVKVKAVVDDQTLIDTFTYPMDRQYSN